MGPQLEVHFTEGLELGGRHPEHIAIAVHKEVDIAKVVHVGAIGIVVPGNEKCLISSA